VQVRGDRSSQYLSALLFLGPLLDRGLTIHVTTALRSQALVRATLRAMSQAGIHVEHTSDLLLFAVPGQQTYQPRAYTVPADGPSAAALLAAAYAHRSAARITHLDATADDVQALASAFCGTWAATVHRTRKGNCSVRRREDGTLRVGGSR